MNVVVNETFEVAGAGNGREVLLLRQAGDDGHPKLNRPREGLPVEPLQFA